MNPNHSEELYKLYSNFISNSEESSLSKLIATLTTAGGCAMSSGTKLNPRSFSLDSEILKEEIECDVKHILVKNLREIFKKLETSLIASNGKRFGFREIIDSEPSHLPYAAPSSTSKRKRSYDSSMESPLAKIPKTPESGNENVVRKKARMETDTTSNDSDDSDDSNSDGELQIDLNESEAEGDQMNLNKLKTESDDTEKVGDEKTAENEVVEPVVEIKEGASVGDTYRPAFLRIERLKSIQSKKPKFNINPTDLQYHSSMARQFPGSEGRSEDQQMRRDKNTLAARISRTKNKAYEKLLEDQSLEVTTENINMKRRIACLRGYANSLMTINDLDVVDFNSMWEENVKDILVMPSK